MAQREILALDTEHTDVKGKYIARAPAVGDSYIAPRSVHFADNFTVEDSTLIPNLNVSLLEGNSSSAFATSTHNHSGVYEPADTAILKDADMVTHENDANTHTNLIVDGQYF